MLPHSTMKKSLSLCFIIGAMVCSTSMSVQAKTVSGFKIGNCHEDYEDVNFCSAKFVKHYQKAIKKGINFNHKYALALIPSSYGYSEVVAIDTKKKTVTTLGVEIKPTGNVRFNKESDTLCFNGDISGYRQDNSYSKVCYQLVKDEFADVNPEATGMEFIQSHAE